MLTPQQVIPFLTHEEGFVRAHAAEYLTKAHDPSPATAADLWPAIDRYGMWGPAAFVADLHELPQTEESLWRAMGALSGTLEGRTRDYLEEAVESVGMPLLRQFREELLAGLQLSDESKAHLRQRLELAGRDPSELWDELMALGQKLGGEWPDEQEVKRLVEAIGNRADEVGVIAKATSLLRDESVTDWREVFAVDVLGEARHAPSIDLLLEKLRIDDDVMPGRATNALVRIGTAEVVRKVEAFLPNEEWFVRLYGLDALGRIKRPESEAALLRLLERETDRELATLIGESLCLLGAPPDVLAMLRDRVAVGRLGEVMGHDLAGMILAAGRMVGYEPPENKKWTERAHRMDQQMDQMRAEIAQEFERHAEEEDGEDLPPLPPPPLEPEVTWPIHRPAQKVGRNDPCPCGSGKKYKKCCGKG